MDSFKLESKKDNSERESSKGTETVGNIFSSVKSAGLTATVYDSGFHLSSNTYNGIYSANDGKIYYVLTSESIKEGGKMYSFDPKTKQITLCGDLTEACGEKQQKTIPQGMCHVTLAELQGKLFFGTNFGYYNRVNGTDFMGITHEGYKSYPGGHLLSYDMKTKNFNDLGIVVQGEGVLAMSMDTQRNLIYGITWPNGYFFIYDLNKNEIKNLGAVSGKGENRTDNDFRPLCRSIAINPDDGSAYFSTSEGNILCCDPGQDVLKLIMNDNLKKDYFGHYEISSPDNMGYNWRQTFWYPPNKCIYGVHGNSGYLFRFDPRENLLEVLDRVTSKPSQQSGMFNQFSYGYLGFMLGRDGQTIYYLTGSPLLKNGKRVASPKSNASHKANMLENLHLITYHIPTNKYQDHGPIYLENGEIPLYVNSITIGLDGTIYFLGRITENNKTRTDLISIPNPIERDVSEVGI